MNSIGINPIRSCDLPLLRLQSERATAGCIIRLMSRSPRRASCSSSRKKRSAWIDAFRTLAGSMRSQKIESVQGLVILPLLRLFLRRTPVPEQDHAWVSLRRSDFGARISPGIPVRSKRLGRPCSGNGAIPAFQELRARRKHPRCPIGTENVMVIRDPQSMVDHKKRGRL